MPRPVVCPHCREELDIPAEFRGREVRCAVCRNTFTPPADDPYPAPAARDGFDDPRGRADRRSDRDDRDPYRDRLADRPRRRVRKGGGTAWVWVLVLGVFGTCFLGCGGLLALGLFVENPDLQPYDDPAGKFRAEFPGKPAADQVQADGETRHTVEARRKFPAEVYFVHYTDLPRKADEKGAEAVFKKAADAAVKRVPGSTLVSSTPGTHDGYPTTDVHVQHPDRTATMVRFLVAGKRLYAVGITGQALQPGSQRLEAFLDAFKVKPPPPPAK